MSRQVQCAKQQCYAQGPAACQMTGCQAGSQWLYTCSTPMCDCLHVDLLRLYCMSCKPFSASWLGSGPRSCNVQNSQPVWGGVNEHIDAEWMAWRAAALCATTWRAGAGCTTGTAMTCTRAWPRSWGACAAQPPTWIDPREYGTWTSVLCLGWRIALQHLAGGLCVMHDRWMVLFTCERQLRLRLPPSSTVEGCSCTLTLVRTAVHIFSVQLAVSAEQAR